MAAKMSTNGTTLKFRAVKLKGFTVSTGFLLEIKRETKKSTILEFY